MRRFGVPVLLALFFALPSLKARAQDYPYDDTQLQRNESPVPQEKDSSVQNAPNGEKKSKRLPALFRLGLKAGGNFAIFELPNEVDSTLTDRSTGFGIDALLSFNWDLPYQPISLEFESGWRSLLAVASNTDPFNVIPFDFGVYYRDRTGVRSAWKAGIKAGLDLVIDNVEFGVSRKDSFAVMPSLSFATTFEFSNFLIEPVATIYRLQNQRLFFVFATRAGIRF
jgi:hypothetical protein